MTSVTLSPAAALLLQQARELAQQGDPACEAAFHRLLELEPTCTEALVALSRVHFAQQQWSLSEHYLRQALSVEPNNAHLHRSLGLTFFSGQQFELALQSLLQAVALAPAMFQAHLHIGKVLEQLGRKNEATHSYFRAITRAQAQELWLDESTIAPWLLKDVLHAMQFVQSGRHEVLWDLLTPLKARFGETEMQRLGRSLAAYLGTEPNASPDPRQRPRFLYFPDLPIQPYYSKQLFPWLETLEAQHTTIRRDALACLNEPSVWKPFLEFKPDEDPSQYLANDSEQAQWNAVFFYRHGQRHDDNHLYCPQTSATIESLPLVRIAEHAPEICFSVLTAGTHILPHHGVSNIRLVVHLPLIVPEQCALNVGGELHVWQEGQCVIFDDTFEHEAWNRGTGTRTILLMDTWNPYLTESEKVGLTELIEGIGHFNRG